MDRNKNRLVKIAMVFLCIITLYVAIGVIMFINCCEKDQGEQIEILNEISRLIEKIKLPQGDQTFTIDAAVQPGATIIINEIP